MSTYLKYPPPGGGSTGGSGTVTTIEAGPGLAGGTITTSGSISFLAVSANKPMRSDVNGLPTVGSTSLANEVSGLLPLSMVGSISQTAILGSVNLTNQVSGFLPLGNLGSISVTTATMGSVSLTDKVSGILPFKNGGTNSSASFQPSSLIFSGSSTAYTGQFRTVSSLTFDNGILANTCAGTGAPPVAYFGNPFSGLLIRSVTGAIAPLGGGAGLASIYSTTGTQPWNRNPIPGAEMGLLAQGANGQRGLFSFSTKNVDDDTTNPTIRMIIAQDGSVTIGSNTGTAGFQISSTTVRFAMMTTGLAGFDATGVMQSTTKSSVFTMGSVTHTSSAIGAAYTLTWPGAQGGANTVPSNDGAGNLSWASVLTNPLTTSGAIIIGSGAGTLAALTIGSSGFAPIANPSQSPALNYESISSPDDLTNIRLNAAVSGGAVSISLYSSYDTGNPGSPPTPARPVRIAFRNPNGDTSNNNYKIAVITSSMSMTINPGTNLGLTSNTGGYYFVYLLANPATVYPQFDGYSLGVSAATLDELQLQNSVISAQSISIGNGSASWSVPTVTNIAAGMKFSLLSNGGTFQTGFSPATTYYVVSPTATGFGLSATPGGNAITAGSGGSLMSLHPQSPGLITNSLTFTSMCVRLLGRVEVNLPATFGSISALATVTSGGTLVPRWPVSTQTFFAIGSGTYYPPPTAKSLKVTCVGGGGGGGGTASVAVSAGAAGGGGGGATTVKWINNIGSTYSYSVSAGGSGGSSGNNPGSSGSATFFGGVSVCYSGGGGGGNGSSGNLTTPVFVDGAGGGIALAGDLLVRGGPGTNGLALNGTSQASGGSGGSSTLSGGARGPSGTSGGANCEGYGGGGSGAVEVNNGGAQAGGAGAGGLIIIEEIYS